MSKNIAVKLTNVSKSFKTPLESSSGVKQKIINTLKGRRGYRIFNTLKNISFEIEEGEFFGIVGRNGSGKSTLLKLIAGIYHPDNGSVEVNGKLVPFIELGVGFNPELTGRENVFLNGALLGFSRPEMESMYKEIVDFAELHDFMEERLKNYSSGMQVRLAFSIAIRAEGDILLLDEVLAVGDEAFQRKCFEYFNKLKREGRTVILVTHDMSSVQRFCTRAMFINNGVIEMIDTPEKISGKYTLSNLSENKSNSSSISVDLPDKGVTLTDYELKNTKLNGDDDIVLNFQFEVNKKQGVAVAASIRDQDNTILTGHGNTRGSDDKKVYEPGVYAGLYTIKSGQLLKGEYTLNLSLWGDDDSLLDCADSTMGSKDPVKFTIINSDTLKSGKFSIDGEWRMN